MTDKKAPAKKKTPAKTATVADLPNLLQRISAIQAEVSTVSKDAKIDNKYEAVTHDAVTTMLRPLMVKHGVVSTISLINSEVHDTGVKYGQRKAMQLRSKFKVAYMNIDKPGENFYVEVEAHADDAGDKAPGKVMSYAQKYVDLKVFRISTGEDEEQRLDESKYSEPTLTAEHLTELVALAEETLFDDADATLKSLAKNVFQVDGYVNILDKHFDVAIRKIRGKAEDND